MSQPTSRLIGSRRRRVAVFAALVLALGLAGQAPTQAQIPGPVMTCHISSASALVFADTPEGDAVTYYAHVIMYTRRCGLSPAEVQATFRPVAGSASTCDFKGTMMSEYALCQGARGVAAPGTQVVIDATGRTYGNEGVDTFASSCTVVLTPLPPASTDANGVPLGSSGSRASCGLPLGNW
jgi:hypothetical protein